MKKRVSNYGAYDNRFMRFLGENNFAGFTVCFVLILLAGCFAIFAVTLAVKVFVFICTLPMFFATFSALCVAFSVLFSLCIAGYLINLLISSK